jgi:hypothetical protein
LNCKKSAANYSGSEHFIQGCLPCFSNSSRRVLALSGNGEKVERTPMKYFLSALERGLSTFLSHLK